MTIEKKGNRNSGDWNTGDRNSGNWNSGNLNSWYFNTDTPKVRIFNKETDVRLDDIYFPAFLFFYLNDEEYLKPSDYKEAFKKSWENADKEDREKIFDLPNFDADIFYEISGINLRNYKKDLQPNSDKIITIDGKRNKLIDE